MTSGDTKSSQHEDAKRPRRTFAPRGNLLYYSVGYLAAAGGFVYLATLPVEVYRIPSVITAFCFGVAGVLLWLRSKWALPATWLLGLVVIAYGVYYLVVTGFSMVVLGFWIGGAFTLAGYWAIRDELSAGE